MVCQVKLSSGLLVHGPQSHSENEAKEKAALFALQRLVSVVCVLPVSLCVSSFSFVMCILDQCLHICRFFNPSPYVSFRIQWVLGSPFHRLCSLESDR